MDSFNSYIIDSKELIVNVVNVRKLLKDDTKLCAIVKADAYGMGIETICKILKDYCDYFGVACVREAMAIRSVDSVTPILILGAIPTSCYKWCSLNNVSITISSLLELENLSKESIDSINIHIAINTGLNRIGFKKTKDLKAALYIIKTSNNIILEGVFSHFATKQNDVVFIKKQFYNFALYGRYFKDKVIKHISNSFATVYKDLYQLDMVRTGFLLYCGSNSLNNKPILSIKSKVVSITHVSKGESVGYDRNYVANNDMDIGIIPIGYADGLDRRLSNKGYFYINNKKCRIVGNICMDVTMIDITDMGINIGDNVLVLGTDGVNRISLEDYARLLGTSPYEVQLKFRYKRMNYIVI